MAVTREIALREAGLSPDQKFKADGGKAKPTLLEKDMVHALAAVQATLDYGAQKYEARSWKNVDMERYDDAARRHRIARDGGAIYDAESGLLHRAHEIICLLFQLEMECEKLEPEQYLLFNKPPQEHKVATSIANLGSGGATGPGYARVLYDTPPTPR